LYNTTSINPIFLKYCLKLHINESSSRFINSHRHMSLERSYQLKYCKIRALFVRCFVWDRSF
jgi:hypothetical protein